MPGRTDPVLCPKCGTNEGRRLDAPHRCVICRYVCCEDWSQDRVVAAHRELKAAALAPRVTYVPVALIARTSSEAQRPFKRRLFYP